jgi:hypothetical protein
MANMLHASGTCQLNYQNGGTFDKFNFDFQLRRMLTESNELYLGDTNSTGRRSGPIPA